MKFFNASGKPVQAGTVIGVDTSEYKRGTLLILNIETGVVRAATWWERVKIWFATHWRWTR